MPGRWIVPSSVCRLMPYVPRPPNVSSWCLECIVGAQMILAPWSSAAFTATGLMPPTKSLRTSPPRAVRFRSSRFAW